MKNVVLLSVVVALLVFSGCSDKQPAVDTKQSKVEKPVAQEVAAVETETVAAEDSMVDSDSNSNANISSKMSMSDIESELSSVYFGFDKFNIRNDMQSKISQAAKLGKTVASDYNVKLEGNCDEWGSDEYNFALGLRRANAVKKALVAEGIDGSRISMVSYGESNPVCTDQTQACYAKNRRVDFKILP